MSTDEDKILIRPLDDHSDYAICRIRVAARVDVKGYSAAIESQTRSTPSEDSELLASSIIVNYLSDQALMVVGTVIGNQRDMLTKLDSGCGSKSIASRIAKMSELVSTR